MTFTINSDVIIFTLLAIGFYCFFVFIDKHSK